MSLDEHPKHKKNYILSLPKDQEKAMELMDVDALEAMNRQVIEFVENASGLTFGISKQQDTPKIHDDDTALCISLYSIHCNTTEMHKTRTIQYRVFYSPSSESNNDNKIKRCEVLFNSPLHSRQAGQWTSVQSSGDLVDYLLLHMYPDLVLIRSLSYLIFLTSPHQSTDNNNDSKNREEQTLVLNPQFDEETHPKLRFEVENPNNKKKVLISFPYSYDRDKNNQLCPFLTIFDSAGQPTTCLLDSYQNKDYYNAFDLDDDKCDFVEHGFAADFGTTTFVPHPITSKMMNAVLGNIGLGYLSIYDD